MINIFEVNETNKMVEQENLDVRTITMGINLLDCASENLDEVNEKIYRKITTLAKDLVSTGEEIAREFGVPIVNKRISITPISLVGAAACKTPEDYVTIAKTLDRAAHTVGVNFIGGYSAIVSKGMTKSDELLIRSIPEALASTELICSSVNVGSTKTGINMDAVRLMGEIIKETAEKTKDADSLGCAKLVVLCNAPDDNPFMAGAFHGVSEDDAIINVGVSGPGVVKYALEKVRGESFEVLCETIKKTAFKITRVGQLDAERFPYAPDGVLSGGPNSQMQDPMIQGAGYKAGSLAPMACYLDNVEAWSVNECTINWNSPLVWIASFLEDEAPNVNNETTKPSTTTTTDSDTTTTTTTTVATTTASGETTTAGSTTTVDPNADNIGDVNLDGIVDIADAVTLNKYLAGVVQLSDQALRNANCDQSPSDIDNVGDKDTTALVRFVLNMEGYQDLPFIAAE